MAGHRKVARLQGGVLDVPEIYVGGAPFWLNFNSPEHLASEEPYKVILAAFRAGMNAVDLAPLYAQSETVVGKILGDPAFRSEFPRSSYTLITKCGRYGLDKSDFDYSPEAIRKGVANSQKLLHSDHFDVIYLHDVEFVADDPGNASAGGDAHEALQPHNLSKYGLAPDQVDKVVGAGDEAVLGAIKTLFELKDEGVVKNVGMSGLHLPTVLRLARLIRARLGRPLDVLQTYAHLTVQNEALLAYIPLLREAGVRQIVNASPLSMGLLRSGPAHNWHPAPAKLQQATTGAIPDQTKVSLRYGLRAGLPHGIPTVIGVSSVAELDEALESYWEGAEMTFQHKQAEADLRKSIRDAGYTDWIWASPPSTS